MLHLATSSFVSFTPSSASGARSSLLDPSMHTIILIIRILVCGVLALGMFGRTKHWSRCCRGCQGSHDWWWCRGGPSRSQRSPLSFVPLGARQPQCDTGECKWPDSYIGSLIEDTPGPAAAPGLHCLLSSNFSRLGSAPSPHTC